VVEIESMLNDKPLTTLIYKILCHCLNCLMAGGFSKAPHHHSDLEELIDPGVVNDVDQIKRVDRLTQSIKHFSSRWK